MVWITETKWWVEDSVADSFQRIIPDGRAPIERSIEASRSREKNANLQLAVKKYGTSRNEEEETNGEKETVGTRGREEDQVENAKNRKARRNGSKVIVLCPLPGGLIPVKAPGPP